MASPSPDNAGDPGHCALCGVRNRWCLCPRCFALHAVNRTLPAWLVALRQMAQQKTKEEERYPLTFEPLGDDW